MEWKGERWDGDEGRGEGKLTFRVGTMFGFIWIATLRVSFGARSLGAVEAVVGAMDWNQPSGRVNLGQAGKSRNCVFCVSLVISDIVCILLFSNILLGAYSRALCRAVCRVWRIDGMGEREGVGWYLFVHDLRGSGDFDAGADELHGRWM